MKTVPGTEHVDQALKSVERRITNALKRINRLAGNLLSNGDYAGSQSLVQVAQAVKEFLSDICALENKWRALTRIAKPNNKEKKDVSPLWEYYRPILVTLEELGGDALRNEIENAFEERNSEFLKDGDREIMNNGLPRWRIMIHRARKHMVKEGFLDGNTKGRWRITPIGRQTAQGKKLGKSE
jgi:hypothetical protein